MTAKRATAVTATVLTVVGIAAEILSNTTKHYIARIDEHITF